MKKYIFLLCLLIFIGWNQQVVSAESNNGFVSDLFEDEPSQELQNPIIVDDPLEDNETDENLTEDQQALLQGSGTNLIWTSVKIIFALLLIVGLIYTLLKFFNRTGKLTKNGEMLENIGGIPLGTNKSIQIIRIGKKLFVVGVGESIDMLTEITDEETITKMIEEKAEEQFIPNQAIEFIGNKFKYFSSNKHSPEVKHSAPSESFSTLFKSELTSMTEKRKRVAEQQKEKDSHE